MIFIFNYFTQKNKKIIKIKEEIEKIKLKSEEEGAKIISEYLKIVSFYSIILIIFNTFLFIFVWFYLGDYKLFFPKIYSDPLPWQYLYIFCSYVFSKIFKEIIKI